VKQHTVFDV